jgi:ribosome-associated protein
MEDMSSETDVLLKTASSLGDLLREHNGQDVLVMDLRGINNWTDFFIIATATSKAHMDGLERHVKDYCRGKKIEIFGNSHKKLAASGGSESVSEDEWRLIDLGSFVVHLMNKHARDFYELERLWSVNV